MKVQDANVLIMGMGKSGQSAARLALARGAAKVVCLDSNPDAPRIEGTSAVYGPHRKADFMGGPGGAWGMERPDFLVLSPGIPPTLPVLAAASTVGLPVLSEIAFAASQCPRDLVFVGITGTNGKSSTAWFTHQLLKQAGKASYLGGNIGRSLSNLPLEMDAGEEVEIAVVELSSYQLESVGDFHPAVGAILNLTPDHLARHGSMEAYGAAKLRLFQNMGSDDVAILPPGTSGLPTDPIATRSVAPCLLWIGQAPGLVLADDALHISGTPDDGPLGLEGFTLPGEHNRINAGVAAMIAICAGVSRDSLDLSRLEPLQHRLERVHLGNGVEWINDSKATNIESTLAALEGIPGPLLVLLGGQGKDGASYSLLRPILAATARAIICFGAAAAEIAEALDGLPVQQERGLSEAVTRARALARPGDTILLSPACASFDEFSNFEERGLVFTQLARGAKP